MNLSFTLNGHQVSLEVAADRRVVDLLREDLKIGGTKECCGSGECGACTILVDGRSQLSCLMLSAQLQGRSVLTIEGAAVQADAKIVQQAFIEHGAVQCGFCTPGMILATLDLLRRIPQPSREQVRHELSGNLCRCTGYQKIIDAVMAAAVSLQGGLR